MIATSCTTVGVRYTWFLWLTWNTTIQMEVFPLLVSGEHKHTSDGLAVCCVLPAVTEGAGGSRGGDARSRGFYTGTHLEGITLRSNQSHCRLFRVTLPGSAWRTYYVTLNSSLFAVQNENTLKLWSPKRYQPSEIKSQLPPTSCSVFAHLVFPALAFRSGALTQTGNSPWAN